MTIGLLTLFVNVIVTKIGYTDSRIFQGSVLSVDGSQPGYGTHIRSTEMGV